MHERVRVKGLAESVQVPRKAPILTVTSAREPVMQFLNVNRNSEAMHREQCNYIIVKNAATQKLTSCRSSLE